MWAIFMVLVAVALVLPYLTNPSSLIANLVINISGPPALFAYATVGALIASRHPENPIGWLFCGAALLVAIGFFAEEYARYALVTNPGSLPGGLVMAWLAAWLQNMGLFLMFTFLLLLFPDGKLPSRHWRVIAWLVAGAVTIVAFLDAFKTGPVSDALDVQNPLGTESITGVARPVEDIVILITVVVCAVSVVVRFRHAEGEQRPQIKWFAYAAVLALVQFGLRAVLPLPDAASTGLFVLPVAAFPVAAGIAILKYRLYDIDLLINRTLVYIPLTAILAGVYAASLGFFQKVFLTATGEQSDAAVVITTLILVSSFTPIKNSLQTAVDKRFKEARDPIRKLRAFGEQVRSFVELNSVEQLTRRLLDEATSAFNATCGAIYLGRQGEQRLVHTCGEWSGDAQISVPLQGHGEQIGVVSLGARRNGSIYTPQDREALQDITDVVVEALEVRENAS